MPAEHCRIVASPVSALYAAGTLHVHSWQRTVHVPPDTQIRMDVACQAPPAIVCASFNPHPFVPPRTPHAPVRHTDDMHSITHTLPPSLSLSFAVCISPSLTRISHTTNPSAPPPIATTPRGCIPPCTLRLTEWNAPAPAQEQPTTPIHVTSTAYALPAIPLQPEHPHTHERAVQPKLLPCAPPHPWGTSRADTQLLQPGAAHPLHCLAALNKHSSIGKAHPLCLCSCFETHSPCRATHYTLASS